MTSDRDGLLRALHDTPLDQAVWAMLADCLLEGGDQAGYDVVTGKVLAEFNRFAEYEERRGLGQQLFKIRGSGVMVWASPVRRERQLLVQESDAPHDPDRDVRWWLLYVENRDYDAPEPPTTGRRRLVSRDGVLHWEDVPDPKATAEPRMMWK